ncbi:MAG: rod shape-determining protein MreD [Defluviimonas sp.]|nr:rod shape-determining protein MreD [Defluviimonas sp.]
MIDPATTRLWAYRGLYLALAALLLFVRLLPLSTQPARVPGPDLMLCITLAWVLRRPDFVPALIIVAVFVLEDMLAMRPPGLWALIVLLGSEFLRDRAGAMRGLPFLAEWATVAAVMAIMLLANRLVLALVMVPQTGLGPTLLQLLATAAAYPLVVAASHLAPGLRRASDIDAAGSRA